MSPCSISICPVIPLGKVDVDVVRRRALEDLAENCEVTALIGMMAPSSTLGQAWRTFLRFALDWNFTGIVPGADKNLAVLEAIMSVLLEDFDDCKAGLFMELMGEHRRHHAQVGQVFVPR